MARTIKYQPANFSHHWSNKISILTTHGHLTPAPPDKPIAPEFDLSFPFIGS